MATLNYGQVGNQGYVGIDDATLLPAAHTITGGLLNNANYVWNTVSLTWVKATQASGGGGGGGLVQIQDSAGNNLTSTTGSLNVNVTNSSGGSNAAAGTTGAAVPSAASYTGWNSGGNLVGISLTNGLPIQPGTGATFPVSMASTTITGTVSTNNANVNFVSTLNSTTATLGSNATYTGTWELVQNYSNVGVIIYSDQSSASLSVFIDYSSDGVNLDTSDTYSVLATIGVGINNEPHGKYYRIRYVNGSVAQNVFRLQTILSQTAPTLNKFMIGDTVTTSEIAILAKSVITGKTTGIGTAYVDVKVNPSGAVAVDGSGVTQPVSGTFWQTTQPVSLSSLPTGSNVLGAINVQDGNGNKVNSISAGTGANGLLVSLGATNYTPSTVNTTSAQLQSGEIFTGGIENGANSASISIDIVCDQPGLLTINQYVTASANSICASNSFVTTSSTKGNGFCRSFTLNGNYVNISFRNIGTVATTTLVIDTAYGNINPATQLMNMPMAISEIGGVSVTTGAVPIGIDSLNKPHPLSTDTNGVVNTTDINSDLNLNVLIQILRELQILNYNLNDGLNLRADLDGQRADGYFTFQQ